MSIGVHLDWLFSGYFAVFVTGNGVRWRGGALEGAHASSSFASVMEDSSVLEL